MRPGRCILAGKAACSAGVGLALLAGLSTFVTFTASFDGWMLHVGRGMLKTARYQSPQNITARREAGFTSLPPDARSLRLWFPPTPTPPPTTTPNSPPLPSSGPTSLIKRVVAQGTYSIPAQRWTAGVFAWESINGFGIRSEGILVALWGPALLLTAGGAWLWRRGRRRTPGKCPTCGYALAGLAPGSPCPECGPPLQSPPPRTT